MTNSSSHKYPETYRWINARGKYQTVWKRPKACSRTCSRTKCYPSARPALLLADQLLTCSRTNCYPSKSVSQVPEIEGERYEPIAPLFPSFQILSADVHTHLSTHTYICVTIEGFSKQEIKGYVDWKPSTNSAATAGGNAGVSGS
jgi:hypothetical protein